MPNTQIRLLDILRSGGSVKTKAIKLGDYLFGSFIAMLVKNKSETSQEIPAPIKNILVIRPGGIGDAIFLVPVLKALKNNNPNLQIDILCEKRNIEVFNSQEGLLNHIYCYDDFNSFQKLFKEKYDIIFDTEQWHYLSALVSYLLTSRLTVGFGSRPLRKKLFSRAIEYYEEAYELENFEDLFISVFGDHILVPNIQNSFVVTEEEMSEAGTKLPGRAVALFLGASIPAKRLSFLQHVTLINTLFSKRPEDFIILLGGSDVIEESIKIENHFNNPKILNYVGQTSLKQTAVLIKFCELLIGPDSGVTHLAEAVGTPVIAIFGPSDPNKWGPRGAHDKILSLEGKCSTISLYSYTLPCRHGFKTLHDLDINKIINLLTP